MKLERNKKFNLTLSILYRAQQLLPTRLKFKLFLNLEWIFNRLAHEASFQYYKNHPAREICQEFLLSEISAGDKVIDIGCNLGEMTDIISKKAYCIGVDISSDQINTAKRRYPHLEFYHSEARRFLNGKRYDILILSHILEHLDDPEEFLKSLTFKKIYIEVPDFEKTYLNLYRKDLKLNLIYSDVDHVLEFNRVEIFELFKNCGLKIISSEYRLEVQRYWCTKEENTQ